MEDLEKRRDQINWNQVYYFSEIAAAGSLKAAAAKLRLSPSTLSDHLRQLELDLNLKLFTRQHRKITLTADGSRLFHSARQMFEVGKRFIDVISPNDLGSYPVAIGLVPGSSYNIVHEIISAYITLNKPDSTQIHRYQHDELELALLDAKLDFGFTDRKSERKAIEQIEVMTSELRLFVSSEIPQHDARQFLKKSPLILCRSERTIPSAIEEILEALDLAPENLIISEYPSLVESLCRAGQGIAVLGRSHFEHDSTLKMLELPIELPKLTEKLFATWACGAAQLRAIKTGV